jgi:predicted Kef-type K+ transport protein
VAVALTFSSTIIIVKLLSDKREIDSLHGRIAVGFLIVQDIVVVLAMITLSPIGVGDGPGDDARRGSRHRRLGSAGCSSSLVAALHALRACPAAARLARSPELLVLFAIAWAVALAALGDWLGFSKEVGGLPRRRVPRLDEYREAIASRLSSLRDFLLLFFFIDLGDGPRSRSLGDRSRRRGALGLRARRQPAHRHGDHGASWATASAPASSPG